MLSSKGNAVDQRLEVASFVLRPIVRGIGIGLLMALCFVAGFTVIFFGAVQGSADWPFHNKVAVVSFVVLGVCFGGMSFFSKTLFYWAEDAVNRNKFNPSDRNRHFALRQQNVAYLALRNTVCFVIATTVAVHYSTYFWFQLDPAIFKAPDNSHIQIALFSLDLFFRGALFDFMEHFEIDLSDLKLNPHRKLYAWYSFAYRSYVSALLVTTFTRCAILLYQMQSVRSTSGMEGAVAGEGRQF